MKFFRKNKSKTKKIKSRKHVGGLHETDNHEQIIDDIFASTQLSSAQPSRRRVTISVGCWNSFDKADPTLPVVWFPVNTFPNGIGVGSRVIECQRTQGPQAGAVVESIESKFWYNKPLTYIAVTFSGPFGSFDGGQVNPHNPVLFETEINA